MNWLSSIFDEKCSYVNVITSPSITVWGNVYLVLLSLERDLLYSMLFLNRLHSKIPLKYTKFPIPIHLRFLPLPMHTHKNTTKEKFRRIKSLCVRYCGFCVCNINTDKLYCVLMSFMWSLTNGFSYSISVCVCAHFFAFTSFRWVFLFIPSDGVDAHIFRYICHTSLDGRIKRSHSCLLRPVSILVLSIHHSCIPIYINIITIFFSVVVFIMDDESFFLLLPRLIK